MKRAPLIAGLSVLLLIFGIAASRPTTSDKKVLPLDFTGIDTLEVIDAEDAINIEILAGSSGEASFDDLKQNEVTATRAGARMTIRTKLLDYSSVKLVVPTTVHTFVVARAAVESKSAPDEVLVRASASIRWEGDIRQLRIEATLPSPKCKKGCGLDVHISDGTIVQVQVTAPGGNVRLENPDKIGVADLYLGPRGKLTLSDATRLGNIVLHDSAAAE